MKLLLKWIISALAILIAAYLVPGVIVSGFWAAFWIAAILAVINILIKPILIVFTLPINILTLGLFTFVINGLLVLFASSIVKGFQVEGFLVAMLFSIVLSVVNYVLSKVFVDG